MIVIKIVTMMIVMIVITLILVRNVYLIWLVVWNIFYFPVSWEFHHPI